LIKCRLSEARAETIICYADHDNDSPISHAKRDSDRHIAYQDFCSNISDMVSESQSGYKVDLARALSKIGVDRAYDSRNWYLAHCHLSSDGIELLTNLIHQVSSRITRPPKKLLVLDCDNTLWGGVVGEDGVRGLKLGQDGLGQAFVDFQKAIKKVAQEGTLLAICSKNNENDVMSVFEEHHAMVLKKEDIVSWKVNWDQKSDNIRLIAQELDLGLESFVFWDDNPMERDLVRQNLPMVETPEAPKNVIEWPKLFQSMSHFAPQKTKAN
jgi:HAD superfamily phosphatase (TIGR01681 family)